MRRYFYALRLASAVSVLMIATDALGDVVVAYDRPPPRFGRPAQEILRRHGESLRIDRPPIVSGTGAVLLSQSFTRPGQGVSFELVRFEDGRPASLTVMDDPLTAPPRDSLRIFTGETQTVLGEKCRVWRVTHTTKYPSQFVQSGCVTADGVELWRRQADIDAIFATKITREPVPESAVRPPTEMLNLSEWVPSVETADHSRDYEVVFEPVRGQGEPSTIRRSGNWTSRGSSAGLSVENVVDGVLLRYARSRTGERQLVISRWYKGRPAIEPVRIVDRPDEMVLGETCQWWDMTPNTVDAGTSECRTADGIVTKVESSSRGIVYTAVAVRLIRSRQPLSAVLPRPEISSAAAWGF